VSDLAERLEAVRSGVASAVSDAGAATPELIVVTKFHPASLIRELHALGVRHVGESRHQEAREKSAELADLDLTWHFVGQVQSKKAKQIAEYSRVIHSVDRESLVAALPSDRQDGDGGRVDVFLQVNLTADPGRGGVAESGVERLAERVLAVPGLRLLGVMAVAPVGDDPRSAFARVHAASSRVQVLEPAARFISAGMSGDYREAILEGATHLRIGSAITGMRPEGR
jgi:pyridoxal phosphate enzyme (YggS family)